MKYEKPELNVRVNALSAIQGGKDNLATTDSEHQRSIPAYQVDE